MLKDKITSIVNNNETLRFEDLKIGYFLLKPNAEKHYKEILSVLEKNQFIVLCQYAVFDYDTVNMALHMEQPTAMKYLIPISHIYKDFYGNYGVLIVVAKRNITYSNFCLQLVSLKKYLRSQYEYQYVSYTFDTSQIGQCNEKQKLILMDKNGIEIKKNKFNKEGTYMLFSVNEIHSPDEDVKNTIKELKILADMGLFDNENIIPKPIINNMKNYKTFEFLKDML